MTTGKIIDALKENVSVLKENALRRVVNAWQRQRNDDFAVSYMNPDHIDHKEDETLHFFLKNYQNISYQENILRQQEKAIHRQTLGMLYSVQELLANKAFHGFNDITMLDHIEILDDSDPELVRQSYGLNPNYYQALETTVDFSLFEQTHRLMFSKNHNVWNKPINAETVRDMLAYNVDTAVINSVRARQNLQTEKHNVKMQEAFLYLFNECYLDESETDRYIQATEFIDNEHAEMRHKKGFNEIIESCMYHDVQKILDRKTLMHLMQIQEVPVLSRLTLEGFWDNWQQTLEAKGINPDEFIRDIEKQKPR